MGTTPVGQITAAGFIRPTFAYTLNYGQTNIRAIYGQDTYLGADSQDGQLVALEAQGVYDVSGVAEAVYNAFSPATAIGTGLDRVVKINGIARKRATYSTAPLRIIGRGDLVINNGSISDPAGNVWAFPAKVAIPNGGQVDVTITCQTKGAIGLSAGGIDTANGLGAFAVDTLQAGLQSAVTIASASPGQPVETDSGLRQRQSISTALPSLSINDGLAGALAALSGVNRLKVYENDTGITDISGIPGHCIAPVLDGGNASAIAQIIRLKKGPGVSTFGSTVQTISGTNGIPKQVAWSYLAAAPIAYAITLQNLGGLTLSIQQQIQQALSDWTNGLDIGEDVIRDQAFTAAKLYDGAGSKTFKIASFMLARVGVPMTLSDAFIAFNEAATCIPANVAITVLPS